MNWNPVRRGPIYCSPSCGAGCTHHQYEQAKAAAEACLARMKSKGWEIRLNENCGWFWSITKKVAGAVISLRGGQLPYKENPAKGFHAMLSSNGFPGSCDAVWSDNAYHDDPNEAVTHRLKVAGNYVKPINKLIANIEKQIDGRV